MAAPQQHALTNTSCTFPASPAVFSSSGNYGGGQPASCSDLHDRLSGISNCDIQSVVYSSAAVVSQPILSHTASRKTKPCSLCGTAAQRSQSCVVPNSPISPQEQPVVLLHRLEDGLPEGDVDSLRAFGTIRLLPVHRRCGKTEVDADNNKHECDRKYQSVESDSMSPGSLFYKSINRASVKKRTEVPVRIHSLSDRSGSLTKGAKRNYIDSDNYYQPCEKTEKDLKNITSVVKLQADKGTISHSDNTKAENVVYENSAGSKLNPGHEVIGAHVKAAPRQSPASPVSQSSQCLFDAQQWRPSSSLAESLTLSASTRYTTSNDSPSPQTSKSSITAIHSHTSTSQSPCDTHDSAPSSSSPSTPMSLVCSPVVQLPSTTLSSSPSQNISSPPAISPPESPPSLTAAFLPPLMGSPVTSERETEHAACSVDVQPSSPYSPCTTPSLPASPASLPSSSDSPPSPAPSLESPPVSPVTSSDYQRVSHKQAHHPYAERPDKHSPSDTSVCEAESDTVLQSKVKVEQRKVRDHKVGFHCHRSQLSSMENAAVPANKSSTDQRLVTPVPTPSKAVRAPSSNSHTPENTCITSQNRDSKTQVDSFSETSSVCASGEKKENEAETEQVSQDLTKCFLTSESGSADLEKSSSDYKNSLMKLVLKVKHPGSQQPQLGSEKKEHNKESGIPKIVLTLTGKGPNKEYSCSNRIRHDNENCSENLNNKKHKSKRNKRQKPKDREKPKKIVKGDKHKRHLELFGEDSNDSCDIDFDSSGDHQGEWRHSRTPSLEEQEIHQFREPLSPEESVCVRGERDFPPPVPERESSSGYVSGEDNRKIRAEENTKNKDPSAGLVDEPSSLSLAQVKSDNLGTNETLENSGKDLPSTEENKETPEGQVQPIENNMKECISEADEAPEACNKEPSYSESENIEETLTPAGMLHSSDISQPSKEPDDLILRSRKSRHAKNTESGRNSDACLWVSFGMNAPLPLPTIDAPSLKRIFTSKERTKQKGSVSSESKRTFSTDEPSISVTGKSISKANHKDHKDREKTEAVSEVTKESKERIVEEKAKPPAEYDHKHNFSSSNYRTHSSSSFGERSHVHSRVRSKDDPVHHRHRHSHKRSRKSEESRERMAKKEVPSSHQNSWKPTHKDDFGSQKVSINNSHKEKSSAVNAQMQTAEKNVTNTPSTCPTVSPLTDDGLPVQQVATRPHPLSFENAVSNNPNKEFDNIDKPNHFNAEESPEKQYYRPKKIRKICHLSTTSDQWNEKKSLEPTEDEKAHGSQSEDSTPNSYKNSDSFQYSVETVAAPLGPHVTEPEAPTAESDASIIQTGTYWKLHEDSTNTEKLPTTPQDAETVHEHRKRKYRSPTPQEQEPVSRTEEEPEEQTQTPAAEEKETVAGKQENIKKDSIPENEENEKQEIEKREKERRKKSSRREKRRDFSSAGSRSSVLQEVQHRREVEHEEERGRRLAQEIKGFNWLEQKIKNGSLLSSVSSPATPTASPATKETESASRTLSAPAAAPPTPLTIASREEGLAKKKILSGSSGGIGLKGHLQTAVPPLIPSSRVTALPKRSQSLGTSTTPPCSASSAISSVTTVPSMTVQGALYTCEPTPNRSEHGRVGSTLENSNIGFEHEHSVHYKATLYSSTTSSKATLYGVKDNNIEAFYDTDGAHSRNYYGGVNTESTDTQYSITTSPTISFYGSAKYQESNIHSQKSSSAGSSFNSSVISSSSSSSTLKDHQRDPLHSPKSKTSDWPAKQELNLNDSSKPTGSSVDSHCSQQFSHKQTLLRRAFQEMLKSEHNSSSKEQSIESQDLAETEMKKADASKCKETEVGINSTQSSSGRASTADTINASFISNFPDSTPPCPANISSEITDSSAFLYAQESITPSVKLSKDLIGSVHDEDKKSSPATEKEEISENITCKLNLDSNQTQKSKNDPDVKGEDEKNCETSRKSVCDTENVKLTEDPKDLQTNIINSIVSDSGVINVKVLKDEIVSETDDKSKEDPEVQPTLLLSVLYKELLKTRKEVEKLRKVQELMLTEKGEKKEDVAEQNTDNKAESDKTDENANTNERISEKRKEKDESHDTELNTDDEFHQESKRSRISIRSDLLPKEECMALDATASNTSPPQKDIPQPQQAASPTLASPTVIHSDSEVPVITLESSAMPEASHLSRVSPVITAASPALSNSTSGPPRVSSASPRGHSRTSPGMSSPGVSRASPGAPRTSPAPPRSGVPLSNISPGLSISPGLPSSPGLQKSSPGIPRSSPGVLRMSPVLARTSSGMLRASPGVPVISPGNSGLGSIKNAAEVISVSPGVSQMIPASTQSNIFNPPTNTSSTDNLPITHCHSVTALVQPKVTIVQSITSPVVPIPGIPQTPVTSSAKPITSPPAVRVSPHISRIDTTASKTDTALTNMSPTKLRSVFGISSSEVELMPISAGGAKYSHHDPQPQTYLKAIEDNHHQINETPLLMNAVRGIHRESSSKEVEPPTSRGPMTFHSLPCPEDPRRTLKTHQYESGVKRHAFSTSDLPDHPASVCKQPPPLKPVSALLRRHSDNLDIHSLMHHQAMYPSHKNLTNSLHPSTSTAEHKSADSMHPFHQTSCAPPQYPMSGPSRRRSSDSSSSERSQEYQQAVSMGMQHPYPHLAPGASVMRSLGPDKASIFPIPPAMSQVIRPFKPPTPPTVIRAQREHYQNENFYRSNFSFFERLREKFATSGDSGVSTMERLQSSAANVEKPIQPQTFAPRVLVRESLPEAPTQIPTTTYSTLHFPNPNQPMPNVMPNHQNHFSSNVHTGSAIHHMAQARLHPNANQAIPNTQRNTTGSGGEKLCFRCSQPARFVCSGCKKAWYCSEHCQREDWSTHGGACAL